MLLSASSTSAFEGEFQALKERAINVLLVGADPFFNSQREVIVGLAAQYAIPTAYQWREFVEAGGLMSYGASRAEAYYQGGVYAGRILNGEKPADLPVL